MNEIAKFQQGIGKIIYRNNLDSEYATAFLINPQIILTVKHALIEYWDGHQPIVMFPNSSNPTIEYEIEVLFPRNPDDSMVDFAVLKLRNEINDIPPLPLVGDKPALQEDWFSFGYPFSQDRDGVFLKGKVNNVLSINDEKDYDIQLSCSEPDITDTKFVSRGASGAPVFVQNGVIGLLTDKFSGAIMGSISISSCVDILKIELQKLNIPIEFKVILDPLYEEVNKAVQNLNDYFIGFPPCVSEKLSDAAKVISVDLLNTPKNQIQEFLKSYQYPKSNCLPAELRIQELFEIMSLMKVKYSKTQLLYNESTANVELDNDRFLNLIYANKRHTKMPEIILDVARAASKSHSDRRRIALGDRVLPYPLILDNCSTHKKFNICKICKSEFSFENIIQDYCVPEEDNYFTGITKNNFGFLQETKVICANCVRKLDEQVEDIGELFTKLEELIK